MAPVQQAYMPIMMPPPGIPAIVQAAYSGSDDCDGKGKGDCDGDCDNCGKGKDNCGNNHQFALFGDFIYLRARDADVAYAVEVNGAAAPPVVNPQVGRVGVLDGTEQPGFRAGVSYVLDECSSITATYTMWESGTSDRVDRTGANVIDPLLVVDSTKTAGITGTYAQGQYDLSMDLIDLDYRELLSCSCDHRVDVVLGVRYGSLEQQVRAETPVNGNETVITDIDFDGVGIHAGLEGERRLRNGRWLVYGKVAGSLLAGEWAAAYDHGNNFDSSIVDTEWEAGRITSIVELEFGLTWLSKCENWRLSAGYMYSAWYGVVKTDEWVTAVNTNNFDHLRDTMTFDGLTARIEARF
jgi:hypothetical protein